MMDFLTGRFRKEQGVTSGEAEVTEMDFPLPGRKLCLSLSLRSCSE